MANPMLPGQPAENPEAVATVEQGSGGGEAKAFGLFDAPMFISLAMIVVIGIIIWKRVPGAIGKALDNKIAVIRNQLAEAEALRTEAEALKAEYQKKSSEADAEAKSLLERARHEADAMLAKAKADADALVERRGRMAEEKIAAEERAAVDKLRATAAEAARQAAARLIAERMDPAADKAIVDQAIGSIR